MADRTELIMRQRALADFGDFVLDHDDLQKILDESCRLIARALDVDLAKVLEIDRASNTALVRAGVGWFPGIVGKERVTLDAGSSEAFAISTAEPVITNDIAKETRFHFPDFLLDHGVIAVVNVPILLPGRKPYGVLQVDARRARAFDQEDIEFLKTYAMVLGPVIDRLKTQAELRVTDKRLRLITGNANDYVMILSDADDRITDWLGGSEAILGWSAADVLGELTDIIFTEEDRGAGVPQRELRLARETGAGSNIRWHRRKDGSRVFLDGQTIALRTPNGELRGYFKIGQDVTERKRNEDRQGVLLAELQHRVRNVLALVNSLVKRTAARCDTAEEMRGQLQGRIDALARTQTLLTQAVGRGVELESLVRDELLAQAIEETRFDISGPPVQLGSKVAEVFSLAVHELATNAVKHGAFGRQAGHLSVKWTCEVQDNRDWLYFTWSESGVDIDLDAPRRRGFGLELITQRVPYELSGSATINYRANGLQCTIEAPLTSRESILSTGSPA